MRILLLLLIIGVCLVSAKYLPTKTRDSNLLSRIKRSDDSDDSSTSIEHDKKKSESNAAAADDDDDDNDDDNDDDDDAIVNKKFKEKEQEDNIKSKALEREEKEKRKQEEQQKKIEEKRAKEQHKELEKREKEERKRLEKLEKEKRKEEEKRLKADKKKKEKEQKQLNQLEKESFDKFEEDDFLETEEESSVELADVWRNHIYVKYGLTLASTKIEKQAALNRYLQEELGLSPNSTQSERRKAIVKLIQTKLQADAAERTALKNQLISNINAVSIQNLRTKLEKDIEDLNNKTQILSNVSLPWVSEARQNVEDKKSFLDTITQFLSSILPNWVIGGQTVQNSTSEVAVISNGPADSIAENNITSESSVTESDNSINAPTEVNAPLPIGDKDSVSLSSVVTGSSDANTNNVNDNNTIQSSVVTSHDSHGATGENEEVLVTGPINVDNSLVPPGENNVAPINNGTTVLTSVNSESPPADSNTASSNSGISVSANNINEESSTGQPSTSIRDNVPSTNISEDTVKTDNSGSISEDSSIPSSVVDKTSITSISSDFPVGINSRPDVARPNEVDTANNSQLSPRGTLSSPSTEDSSAVSIAKVSPVAPDETLITKPDSAFSSSIGISSSNVLTNQSPGSTDIASANENNNPKSSVADNVVSSNVKPFAADGTNISPESDNVVLTTTDVVSFEGNKAVSSNNVDTASTSITNHFPGANFDIATSPNGLSVEGNQIVSSNSVDSVVASINNNVSNTRLDTLQADGREGSVNVGSVSVTESSFVTGSSTAIDYAASKVDLISANIAVSNTTLITIESTTEGNEIANSNVITSASGSTENYNEIASSSSNTVPAHEAGSTGDAFSIIINDAIPETSISSTESNNINIEDRNVTTVNSFGVSPADGHVISDGSTNVNEISIQSIKDVETTIAPEIIPVKPDGEVSAQTLLISTENPVDFGQVNEVRTTITNTISNVNTVSASVETSTPSKKPLVQTSLSSLDNTIPHGDLTTLSLSDGITIPVEEGASVVEILQQ